jgi:uncharacterized protein
MSSKALRDNQAPGARALKAGLAACAREDYVTAYRALAKAAAAGNAEGQYRFGVLHARGHGVLANPGDAIVWFRKAAEQGHAEAQYQMSLAALHGCSPVWYFDHWYRAAAQHDKASAERNFALLFPNGIDFPQNQGEALRWSLAAAEQGHAEAQAHAAMLYGQGVGCEVDYAESRAWYLKAAEQGNAAAECGLGIIYANG